MQVAIDITAAHLTRGGVSIYIRELLQALRRQQGSHEFVTFEYPFRFNRANRMAAKLETAYRDIIWQKLAIPARLKDLEVDLFHSPHARTASAVPVPMVVTVYDLYSFHNPQGFTGWASFYRRFIPKLLEQSRAIITISEFSKQELIRFFPQVNTSKIVVTPLGVASHYRPENENKCALIRKKHELPNRYLLAVNTLEPRKNLLGLIKAFAAAESKINEDLVLIGDLGWIPKHLRAIMQAIKGNPRIHYLGFVPSEDLPGLYSMATAYVFPSFYEGFGLPVLEAMACDCPVVSSRGSSLDEVAGPAALQFDPHDTEDITSKIVQICHSEDLRKQLCASGRINAQRFTWDNTAVRTIEAYQLALSHQ